MNEIEQKARDMARREDKHGTLNYDAVFTALCRAIEQHEAFRQEVSDAVWYKWGHAAPPLFADFIIIPKTKPDPLVEIIGEINDGPYVETKAQYADRIRAALDARGLEIREKNDD